MIQNGPVRTGIASISRQVTGVRIQDAMLEDV
jgi:hypothetical protein